MHRVDSKPAVKLALCIPDQGIWTADFGMAFSQMCVYMCSNLFEADQDRNVIVVEKRTSLLPRSRQECLEDALLQGCTHALFLDVDQHFPSDLAHRLLAWKKPVVAANIARKTMPSFPTALARGPTPFGVPIMSSGKRGLERVWRVGCGVMLLDLAVLKDLAKPWFEVRWSDKNSQFVGEDWYFLDKLEKRGVEFYVDHDISNQVGHVGQFLFTHQHIPNIDLEQAA